MTQDESSRGTRVRRRFGAVVLALLATSVLARTDGDGDGYVLYLSEFLDGDYYIARLGDVDGSRPRPIRPSMLRLPYAFRSRVEIGNADVAFDGRTIVFAARETSDYDWDIFAGSIDLRHRRIRDIRPIAAHRGQRDEDPRFSWNGERIRAASRDAVRLTYGVPILAPVLFRPR